MCRQIKMEPQEKILKTALELFFKFGIKRVTMDDIAKELGMSKKTIYQFYKEKDDIVSQLCDIEMCRHEQEFEETHQKSKDPVHEIMLLSEQMSDMMQHINPIFFLDMQKYYPTALQRFQKFKREYAFNQIKRNIIKGKESGVYREDIDPDFVSNYRLNQIDMFMFGKTTYAFDKISFTKAHELLLDMFVHGVCTIKGHKLINKYKQIKEED